MIMKSKKILLIMAQTGFLYEGCKYENYKVCHPYVPVNLVTRILREFVFRFLPFLSSFFYNKEVFKGDYDSILIWDPLITKRYLNKIHKKYPKANINFIYWNMVGKCSHLLPNEIPSFVNKWTYDNYDSKLYNLNLYSTYPYYKKYIRPHIADDYDVLFIGRDKGRGEFLLQLEKKMKAVGLKTNFIIMKSGRLSKNKPYYHKELSYDEICEFVARSRSVLNVIMENQEGITLRDLEYVYQGVKLVTTNPAIQKTSIYHPNNVFILNDNNVQELPSFLNLPRAILPTEVLDKHTLDAFISEITKS